MSEKSKATQLRIEQESAKPSDLPWFIPSDEEQSVYRFIIAAAKRARQLQAGARPLISTTSRKPTKIAMEEIRRDEVAVEPAPQDEPETDEEPVSE